ncbi:MAG TPA: 2OG-Fe(II) oxygenase [Flavobacteriales bacterium]|nr:2OG-Fe(II) oxygenase [Flavobacteriales bacterium]
MEFIDMERLRARTDEIRTAFRAQRPFHWTTFEGFFKPDKAEEVYNSYPPIGEGTWDGTTYIDQKNKFSKTVFEPGSVMDRAFKELNSPELLTWLEEISGIEQLEADPKLFGGGLHQSITGAFLNVHVDYNFHPDTKHHRRLNVLVYMNKDWKDEYEGHLELWDLTGSEKRLLGKVAPLFNRCAMFETNEISFHGHPRPLRTPPGVNRKSLATYYYTATRPEGEIAEEHNTVYVNTEGMGGQVKRFSSGVKAFLERINKA